MVKKIKIFIDSNVWFSAFYKKGVCSQLLEKLQFKNFEVFISELVLEEIFRNIQTKLPKTFSLVYEFFQHYHITMVKNPALSDLKPYMDLAHKKDVPILTSAINFKCQYFITGNLKDFKIDRIKKKFVLKIVAPKPAIKIFKL